METKIDTLSKVSSTELTQEEVDERFAAMVTRMEDLYALEQAPAKQLPVTELELEAIRDGILGELLERNPHEAIAEIVQSVAMLYEGRTVESRRGDTTVTSFATRDTTNQRLDDHFEIIRHDNGTIDIRASCMAFDNMGFIVYSHDEDVHTYTAIGQYKIPTDRTAKRANGSANTHERILRDFYLQTLSTAGYVLHRRETDPEAADKADTQAKVMLLAEKAETPVVKPYF